MKSKIQISDAPKRVNDIEDIKENIVIVESYINEDATDEQNSGFLMKI